ncbi:MAG TPA: hypothetical protein VK666_15505 [Chryseolinea sp.]|nr:hypothetical protein [Chryseolinea sp.]
MIKQTTIFIIVAAVALLLLLLIIKNKRDRKKLITPDEGTDPVSEKNTEQNNQRDKL